MRAFTGLGQQAVEALGARRFAFGPGHLQGAEKVGQVLHLLHTGRVVHAIDQRRAPLLERLGSADIGLDHHFFDQLMRLERFARLDGCDLAVLTDDDLPLQAVDIQRLAGIPADQHAAVRRP